MAGLTAQLLKVYQDRNKALPDVIIMFRDGVSDGQFPKVREMELAGIRQAYASINPNYKPRVTFATVQKRHQTRLFPHPADPNSSDGNPRNANVKPGIVVDTDICHPHSFDYFLNSHAGIQGTNKPSKYTVLEDQNGLSADCLQQFSYWLCHTFCRCAR